jgi:N-acetylglucosaminyldiphosphoundecaprenol N-acetyl-beta-D-mannosaminyltransferase
MDGGGAAMIDRGKFNVLGVQISAVDYSAAVERVMSAARLGEPLAVSALAVHGVMTGVLDQTHRYRLNSFDLVVPDGQPVRWALRLLHGESLPDRVYGPTLMQQVCRRAASEGLPIFLYGSTEENLQNLERRLVDQHPGLRIAGRRASAFRRLTTQERDEAAEEIRASGARLTLVGLGCPRQEVFVFEMRRLLSMPLLAVGAAFAFHAGTLPQAPVAMQRVGLEWMFRLIQEPGRLWKRYLLLNPLYLTLLGLQKTKLWNAARGLDQPPQEELRYG